MEKTEIQIRDGLPGDATLLADLGRRSFVEAFGAANTPENLEAYLTGAFSPDIQAAELARPGSIFKIAYSSDTPVGYARLQAGSTDSSIKAQNPIELVRLYVMGSLTGRGVGSRLMQSCIDAATSAGHDILWLGVWQHNPSAIRFYERWGFSIAGTHVFYLGSDAQVDYVMCIQLTQHDD